MKSKQNIQFFHLEIFNILNEKIAEKFIFFSKSKHDDVLFENYYIN